MLNITDISFTVKWHVQGWGDTDGLGNFKLSERCGELGLVENGTNFWKKELQRNDGSRSPCGASRNEDHEMPVLTKVSFSVTNEETSAVDAVLHLVQRALIYLGVDATTEPRRAIFQQITSDMTPTKSHHLLAAAQCNSHLCHFFDSHEYIIES